MRSRACWGLTAVETAAERPPSSRVCSFLHHIRVATPATTCRGVQPWRPRLCLVAPGTERRRLIDGLEDLVQGEQQGGLRVPQVVLVDGRFDLLPFGDDRTPDQQPREEVAGEVHEQRARTGGDDTVIVYFDHEADPAMDVLVRDVLRQAGIAREEVAVHGSRLPRAGRP